jgi:hypothetical protein
MPPRSRSEVEVRVKAFGHIRPAWGARLSASSEILGHAEPLKVLLRHLLPQVSVSNEHADVECRLPEQIRVANTFCGYLKLAHAARSAGPREAAAL